MTKPINPDIIRIIKHPQLFGSLPAFKSLDTWSGWLSWLKAVFALPMDESELAIYRQCTGRTDPPKAEPSEAYTIVGRRGGKSFISALTAVFIACFRQYRQHLNAGERAVILVLARDRDQTKIVFNYIKGIIAAIPPLRQMVITERADEIELDNFVTIMCKTSDFRAIRGLTVAAVILDELAFWDSQGVNPSNEIVTALRPAMATIPGAKLLAISTPYAKSGILFEAHRSHFGQDDGHTLVWATDTRTMNPTVSEATIDRAMSTDPDAARAEWMGEFREDLEAAFSLESIEACIAQGRDELPASRLINYRCFVDTSSGRRDAYALAVAHAEANKAVIDIIKAWPAPFDPNVVTAEAAEVAKRYGCVTVEGDNASGEWPVSAFRKHGVEYTRATKSRSELYLDFIAPINSAQIELLDNRQLVDELRRLERRRGRTGRDIIDHPAAGHDDIANSVAGACWLILNDSANDSGIGGFSPSRHVVTEPFNAYGAPYITLTLSEPFASVAGWSSRDGAVQISFALVSQGLHSHLRELKAWLDRYAHGWRFSAPSERLAVYEETDDPWLIEQIEEVIPSIWQPTSTSYDARRQRLLQAFDEYTPLGQPRLQIASDVRLLPEALAGSHDKGTALWALANSCGLLIDRIDPGAPPPLPVFKPVWGNLDPRRVAGGRLR